MKTTRILLALALGVTCATGINASAKETTTNNQLTKTLKSVPAADMPAKAALLVKQAKSEARQSTTINVVKAAVAADPSATVEVVSAIAKAVPDMASVAAATAATLQPKQASLITKAAVAAAPSQVGEIVQAVCLVVPSDYRSVALAASDAAPSASKEIVTAVGTAIPSMKRSISQSMSIYGGSVPSVAIALDQAQQVASKPAGSPSSTPPRAFGHGGPYVTPPATPRDVNTGGSTTVFPNTPPHDYSRP